MKRSLLPLAFLPMFTVAALYSADLPTGESLFLKSIEKSGGAEAVGKVKSSVLSGTLNMAAQNITGTLKVYSEGEKSYSVIELPGVGKVEDGFDGETAWEINAMQGPRIKDNAEKAALRNASSVNMMKGWKDRFREIKTIGIEDVEGKPAYKVQATPREGKDLFLFFDEASGLLTKLSVVVSSPMGEIPTETYMGDYKSIQGVMTPTTMTQKILTTSIVTHFDQVEYNVDVPKEKFDLPPVIKALAEKRKNP